MEVLLVGPQDTPYEGGYFKVKIKMPHDYPIGPPSVFFITKIFHPNISENGIVCFLRE